MAAAFTAIFPRGEKPDDPRRKQIAEINNTLAKFADGKIIEFLELGPKFLAADGTLPKNHARLSPPE